VVEWDIPLRKAPGAFSRHQPPTPSRHGDSVGDEFNRADLPEGSFAASLLQSEFQTHFGTGTIANQPIGASVVKDIVTNSNS